MRKSVSFDTANVNQSDETHPIHDWRHPIYVEFGVLRLHSTYRKDVLIEDFTRGHRFSDYLKDTSLSAGCTSVADAERKLVEGVFKIGCNLPEVFITYEHKKSKNLIALYIFLTPLREGKQTTTVSIPLVEALKPLLLNLHYNSLKMSTGKPMALQDVTRIVSRHELTSAEESPH